MRVISGIARGRKLLAPAGENTRPTADRTKESLFNIINLQIRNKTVLDLFSGSGALGIEALSRGAQFCVFVEKDPIAADIIRKNLTATGFFDKSAIFECDVYGFLKTCNKTFDFVFMDPPYDKNLIPPAIELICKKLLLSSNGIIAAETDSNEVLPASIENVNLYDSRKYGKARLNFYKKIQINTENVN